MKKIFISILVLLMPLDCMALDNFKFLNLCQGKDVSKWDQCVGELSASDGTKYIGDFAAGAANGFGFMQTANKDQIIGEFNNNNIHGIALHVKQDGERYAGDFKENKYHGKGLYKKNSGELISGKWKKDQFKEAFPNPDENLSNLIAVEPSKKISELFSKLAKSGNADSVISEKKLNLNNGTPNSFANYDVNKVYKFTKGLGGPRGVCVIDSSWGNGINRDLSKNMPLWGLELFSVFPGAKRDSGFLWKNDYYFRFENQIVKLTNEGLNESRLKECSYILVKGEELNQYQSIQRVVSDPSNEFKESYSLVFSEAEKEWLNALGYKDRLEYEKAASIYWMLAQARYSELVKVGVTNGEEFQAVRKRKSSIAECSQAYDDDMQGNIDFATDELAAKKAKSQVNNYCSKRMAKIKAEYSRLSKQKVAITAYCAGNNSGTVSTYVSQMDSGGIDVAIKILRANGCVFGQYNFNKANSEIYYEGRGYLALKHKEENVYAVTTKNAWYSPSK